MADTLLIHFNPAKPEATTWSLVNASGELTTRIAYGPLEEASAVSNRHKTVVLLDNTAVHIDKVNLPIKSHQKLLRAIPYALEEHIAEDVDEMHFVSGKPQQNGATPVAAIKHRTLKSIISTLAGAGIEPFAILPDALCLAANSHQWAVLLHDGQANVQFDAYHGGEYDQDSLAVLITSCLQQESMETPEKIILFIPDESNHDKTIENIQAVLPETIELVQVSYNTHPLVVFCGQYLNAMPLNLLQNAYKPKSKGSIEWQRWGLAASLAAVLLGLHLGSASTQYYGLLEENDKLRVQIDKIYKSTFPESKKVVNARVQMEQKLNELKGAGSTGDGANIITLLSDSASALSSEKGITLQAINFRNNKIDLELTSTNLQAIESLNKKLNQQNIKSEIISSSSEKNSVKGSIRIQRAST